jgi:hypothetical protein
MQVPEVRVVTTSPLTVQTDSEAELSVNAPVPEPPVIDAVYVFPALAGSPGTLMVSTVWAEGVGVGVGVAVAVAVSTFANPLVG